MLIVHGHDANPPAEVTQDRKKCVATQISWKKLFCRALSAQAHESFRHSLRVRKARVWQQAPPRPTTDGRFGTAVLHASRRATYVELTHAYALPWAATTTKETHVCLLIGARLIIVLHTACFSVGHTCSSSSAASSFSNNYSLPSMATRCDA